MYIDTHLHLADEKFDVDREATLARAREAAVTTLVEIAESPDTWDAALALADKDPSIYASLGIHPHHAHQVGPAEWPALEKRLRQLLKHPKVVALGEFGLDYFRMQNTPEQQAYLFRQQLSLAKELHKPIVIHCRDAHADVQKAIAEFFPETSVKMDCPQPVGVIHCFSGAWSDAQTYLMHGFYLGVDAPVTYPSARTLQDVVSRLPVQRIVLETDSPYLPPQSFRGQRNEPAHIPVIAEAVSTLKHKATTEIAEATTLNARRLFRL